MLFIAKLIANDHETFHDMYKSSLYYAHICSQPQTNLILFLSIIKVKYIEKKLLENV